MTIEQYDSLYQLRCEISVLEKEIEEIGKTVFIQFYGVLGAYESKDTTLKTGSIYRIGKYLPDRIMFAENDPPKPSPATKIFIEQMTYHMKVRLEEMKKEFETKSL